MKKFYLVICLIGISLISFGQTYVFENFSSNQMPPAGWTIDGQAAQWSINTGNNAGGVAPEAKFHYTNGTATSRLISPAVDLTGLDMVNFQFRHYLDDYSGSSYSIGVATRSGGGAWNDVWTVNPTGNMGPELLEFEITNDDVGQSDFQICIYFSGNMYNFDDWYIDDIWLFIPLNLDAGMTAITTPTYLGGPSEVTGIITNFGSSVITSVEISWQVDDGEVFTTLFDGISLNFGDTYDFVCDQMLNLPIGSYTLKVWIVSVNGVQDEDPTNDMAEKNISVVSYTVQHKPCLEEFTSSTCGPCATFNNSFVPWCSTHEDEITLVKYQMNWPGSGDPYYTAEGGVRREWYGVTWVPWTNLDGTYTDNNMSTINTMFNASMAESGLVKVIGSNSLTGTVMDIDVTVLPFADFSNVVIHIIVFEYLTTQNVGTNGETEFEHVMMKMVPDANGTTVSLEDRVPFTISETVDLAGTNVEEWDDLGVAVIVQDLGSKYIYQSDYTVEDGSFASDATLMSLTVDGVSVPDFSPNVFEYTIYLPAGTVEVPVVEATTNDPNALAIIIPATELPGSTTVDVFAEDIATFNTYTVNFDLGTGSQTFDLSLGFQFISSAIDPTDPDMLVVMTDVLNDNLDFVRNSLGQTLRKIGPNWVNGIGDWIVDEGYLVKMFANDSFIIEGAAVDPTTPIPVATGFQFVSFFPVASMDALVAFETIIGDDLDFIRNSQGQTLRKIGPNWVNGIGDCNPGEGYLVKMFADGEIIYPAAAKSSGKISVVPTRLIFEGGNAAEPVYTMYIAGLEIGDEVAAYNGDVILGSMTVISNSVYENDLPIFSQLIDGHGYVAGEPILLKIWSNDNVVIAEFEMESVYNSYVSNVYPSNDGEFSVVNVTKGAMLTGELVVYPNPATNMINISSTNQINNVVIYNYVGQPVYEGNSTQINTSNFESGIYIIRIETVSGIETQKITIR